MPFPPLDFLFDSSDRSLQDWQISELNLSANIAKQLKVEIDAYVRAEAKAMLAEFMRVNREALLSRREIEVAPPHKVEFMPEREKKRA